MCRTLQQESVNEVDTDTTVTNTVTVLNVEDGISAMGLMRLPVKVNDVLLPLMIDTGAVVSLMNQRDYQRYFPHVRLLQSHLVIQNYSGQVVKNLGFFKAKVQLQNKSAPVTFYVTERCSSLLGLDAIKDLKIVIMVETLSCAQVASSVPPNTPLEFRHLFTPDLGLVTGYIHRLKRRPEVNPVSSKLRRLPLLRQKVADELVRLEATGVIERVDASDWV